MLPVQVTLINGSPPSSDTRVTPILRNVGSPKCTHTLPWGGRTSVGLIDRRFKRESHCIPSSLPEMGEKKGVNGFSG